MEAKDCLLSFLGISGATLTKKKLFENNTKKLKESNTGLTQDKEGVRVGCQ